MKWKISVAVLTLVGILFCLVGCSAEPEHVVLEAKGMSFDTLTEMEDYSAIIVKGVRLEEQQTVIERTDGVVTTVFTLSQFEITEIHKDTTNELEIGDVITILENEAYDETENLVYHVGGYNMMVPEAEYLMFLNQRYYSKMSLTYYIASGVHYGTVSLEEDGRTASAYARGANEAVNTEYYQDIWQAAKEKYTD